MWSAAKRNARQASNNRNNIVTMKGSKPATFASIVKARKAAAAAIRTTRAAKGGR